MKKTISVVGLGYVGLPLAISAAKSGYHVIGIDISKKRVEEINSGIATIEGITNKDVAKLVKKGKLKATINYSDINKSDIILICVPTPLTADHKPDLSIIESAAIGIANYISKGTLVILESTVKPGTTRDFLLPILEKKSNLNRNDFDIAFSPERIDPANKKWGVKNTPKLVSGLTLNACERAAEFYSKFIDNISKCNSLEIAETAKLLENSFRLVNISFINEVSIFCQKLGINVTEVIEAASTKPYGFMPFYPSIGVGGHCIPVDPLYLSQRAQEIGVDIRSIDLADKINQEMPGYFVGKAEEKLGSLQGKKVLVIGVSYKPNVADVREAPAERLISELVNKGAQVFWHDNLVKEWKGTFSSPLKNDYDLAIIATQHSYLNVSDLGNYPLLNVNL